MNLEQALQFEGLASHPCAQVEQQAIALEAYILAWMRVCDINPCDIELCCKHTNCETTYWLRVKTDAN